MSIRRTIVPLTVALFALHAVEAGAQGAFPAPLPGQAAPVAASSSPFPPVGDGSSPFPPVNGQAPAATIGTPGAFPSAGAPPVASGFGAPQQQAGPPGGEACMKEFIPLRQEAEKRGDAIRKASERRAPPAEACKLLGAFAQSETKMISYVTNNGKRCGIPAEIAKQMRDGHVNTEKMRKQVCQVAAQHQQQQQQQRAAAPTFSEILGSSAAMPDPAAARRKGGSTFDTLNGNVLAR